MNHSATRALALLRALNQRPVSTVAELARDTGISKPSVVRLLAILMEDRYVVRASKSGSYALGPAVIELAAGYRSDIGLCRAAGPRMEALTADVQWPSALGFFEQGDMVVRYSTIPSSPLSWYRTTLYHRLPLLGSAMGLVFLAFSQHELRETLLAEARADLAAGQDISEPFFARIRERGYALRAPNAEHPTRSISVPLITGGRIAAALSLTLFGRVMSTDSMVDRYLGRLQSVAAEIVNDSSTPAAPPI